MEGHRLLCRLHARMASGGEVPEAERRAAVDFFLRLAAVEAPGLLRHPPRKSAGGNYTPLFFRPPWPDGKRGRLVTGQSPKTGILHANHYELEILRVLLRFAPDDPRVRAMADRTVERLDRTCFGKFCSKGECTAAGVCALRFFHTFDPDGRQRRRRLLEPLGERFLRAGPGRADWQCQLPVSYFLLTLADIGDDDAGSLVRAQRPWLEHLAVRDKDDGGTPSEDGPRTWLPRAARLALRILADGSNA